VLYLIGHGQQVYLIDHRARSDNCSLAVGFLFIFVLVFSGVRRDVLVRNIAEV
jgi:hypothetical protein